MNYPELRSIISPDLSYGTAPVEPDECAILVEVEVGVKGQDGSEVFSFDVVTPKAILGNPYKRWGRGMLILPSFSWPEVEQAVRQLLMQCAGETWQEMSEKLSREMLWEFDNYKPRNS